VQPKGPYVIGGACVGGQIAFEMARQLAADGQEVAKTFIVESYAPGLLGFVPTTRRGRIHRRFKKLTAELEGSAVGARIVDAYSRVRWGGRHRSQASPGEPLLRTVKRVQRSNLRALLAYDPPTYPGSVVVLRGDRDEDDDVVNMGWDAYAEGGVELHQVSGFHNSVMQPPHVGTVAAVINGCLDRAGL